MIADTNELVKRAYHAYGQTTDFKNYQGLPMPEFDNLTPIIKEAWATAAVSIWNYALDRVRQGELF